MLVSASMRISLFWTVASALLFTIPTRSQTTSNATLTRSSVTSNATSTLSQTTNSTTTSASSQTTDNGIASFLAEAYSIYTEVTSILASDAQIVATSTKSSSASSSTSSSASHTRSITSKSVSLSSSLTNSASPVGAASTSSVAPSSGSDGSGHNTLAIVLGSVLGALALGLLTLVLFLLCWHRRKPRSHQILSPADEEVESWRGNSMHGHAQTTLLGAHPTSRGDNSLPAAAAPPEMAEHPAFRNSNENPFVPVPPTPRRTAPNSRVGLTDGTIPGQKPFIPSDSRRSSRNRSISSLLSQGHSDSHNAGDALATGAGAGAGIVGATLGATAAHHHNQDRDSDSASQNRYSGQKRSFVRKPVPEAIYVGDGADIALLNQSSGSPNLSPFNSAGYSRRHSQEPLLASGAGGGAGALSRAAGADTDRGFFGNRDANSYSPRASSPLVPTGMAQSHYRESTTPPDYDMIPTNANAYRVSRPMSAITPAAALGTQYGDGESGRQNNRAFRNSTPPAVPSRSPRRTRFSDLPYDPANQASTAPLGAISSIDRDNNNNSGGSGDSALRLSSSIPGGWRQDSAESDNLPRNSGINQHGRRSSSPRIDARDFAARDLSVSGLGKVPPPVAGPRRHSPVVGPSIGAGARRQSPVAGLGPGSRRHSQSPGDITSERVRLSDLRAEEEQMEKERQRGRRYSVMGSEWTGGAGYDGYDARNYGVGQAL